MKIRTKILLSHLVKLFSVGLVCLAIIFGLALTKGDRAQLQTSYEQLRNINIVAADANRYSEQIAEQFIIGGQQDDIVQAREVLFLRLQRQRELIEEEQVLSSEPEALSEEFARIDEMIEKVRLIDLARIELQDRLDGGRRAEAERVYTEDIENRLDQMFGQLIERATERERDEVEAALASSARLSTQSIWLAIGLVALVTTISIANVVILNRTILRPISELHTGAAAVAGGDFNHRVDNSSSDELGDLARAFNDMTARIADQRHSLLKAKTSLAEKVETRTHELRMQSELLAERNARLRAIDSSRANFFADISHELRTPLTILRGQAEVALRSENARISDLRAALSDIVQKSEQMGRLVDDLLFLARSESGSIMVERSDVILQEIIGDVLIDGQNLHRRKDIRLRPTQPEAPVVVYGDPDRIRQAILITLDNAIRLAPSGTTVELVLIEDNGQGIVRISDQGPGFTSEQAVSAFTRFYSGHSSRPRSGRGLGLGLSIAKWIVDQHEGSIRIDSAPNQGATVEISVPLVQRSAA